MLLALLIAAVPASSYAGVFISVGFAPPVLPVYVQPPCPEPGWMWTPGYWAYGDDGYYWVPGTWVPSPYVGALWTPGYWGWGGGLYAWHPGYWGRHVGYYGGVNYGFGYMGIGFAGGLWVGGAFRYNTAVMHVGPGIRNVYVDNTIVHNTTIVNDTHVAYSGGPGGINHPATAQENAYSHESHQAATSYQSQHETAARSNVSNYASHNGGHPATAAVARPMSANAHPSINYNASKSNTGNVTSPRGSSGNANERGAVNYNASHSNTGNAPAARTYNASHSNTGNAPAAKTYNASHSNTNAAPAHPGGGQHGGQLRNPPKQEGHEHK
jgi:hypothetical protein